MRCDCLNAARIGAQQPGIRRNTTRQILTRQMHATPAKTPRAEIALEDRETLDSGTLRTRARPREALGGLREPQRRLPSRGRPSKLPQARQLEPSRGAVGRDRSAASGATTPRAGAADGRAGQPRGSEPLLQRRSTKLTARLTQRDEGQHTTPKGQPAAHTQTHATPLRANKAARRWPAATRRRAAPV